MAAASGWSHLPTDLLLFILSKLYVADVVRSAAVCTTWSAAVDQFRNNRRLNLRCRPSPWLLLPSGGGGDARFYSVLEEKVYTFRHSRVPSIRDDGVHRFISSSHGWLFAVDRRSKLRMFNPITGASVDLPAGLAAEAIRSARRGRTTRCSLNLMHDKLKGVPCEGYSKAISSSDPSRGDCTVVLLHDPYEGFSFGKIEDDEWTTVVPSTRYVDAVFHRGQLCMATRDAQLEIWDVSERPCLRPKRVIPNPSPEIYKFNYFSYLVETPRGDLLHVLRIRSYLEGYCMDFYFDVYKVEVEVGRQVRTRRFEQYITFLGTNLAFCLPSKEPSLLQSKLTFPVHFADECMEWVSRSRSSNGKEGERCSNVLPSIWMTPTLS